MISIISTGPHGFSGASQILCSTLRALAVTGYKVSYLGVEKPFQFETFESASISLSKPLEVVSNAIGPAAPIVSEHVLFTYRIVESITKIAREDAGKGYSILLWGTYLFPYGYASLIAAKILDSEGISPGLWLTPTGSDVWEVGPQMYSVTRHLLSDPRVCHIVTYTNRFAQEIRERFQLKCQISSIYPMIDFDRFHPVDCSIKARTRARLGIPGDSFVISSHSNMRPVKRPEDVVDIARSLSFKTMRSIVLLMIGPTVYTPVVTLAVNGNLHIIQTGIVHKVEEYLGCSDVELNCSIHDSFNLSLAEAMACGLPCVSTNIVGIGIEIEKSRSGFLFPIELPAQESRIKECIRYKDAVEYLEYLSKDEEIRINIGRRASEHAKHVFNSGKIIPEYKALIGSTVGL